MILHLFNPEHDIALAANMENFTAPHAGRQLRYDLGFLPALWAEPDSLVLVDDLAQARKGYQRLLLNFPKGIRHILPSPNEVFISGKQQSFFSQITKILPWGWNLTLRGQLARMGISEQCLPTKEQIETIRQLSHRRMASNLLIHLINHSSSSRLLTGKATECLLEEEVVTLIAQNGRSVLKAPWSSSGRGVRFVSDLSDSKGWLLNMLLRQGSVMVEPYYRKVKDFGMEFYSDGLGHVTYLGLSLFHTKNGAYTGNLLATESKKQELLSHYLPLSLLCEVQEMICKHMGTLLSDKYEGPFGIDMMVVSQVSGKGFLLHPCVEINLRRTMGHVALSLSSLMNPQQDEELVRVMRVLYEENNYKIKLQKL